MVATLKKLIAKRAKRKPEHTPSAVTPVLPVMEVRQGVRNRARDLYHLFASIQTRHGQWVVPYEGDTRQRTCFRKLASQFDTFETGGVLINEALYITAHKTVYGPRLRAYHLIGEDSMLIYLSACEAQYAAQVYLTPTEEAEYDAAVIADLADLHDTSPEIITAVLASCGLL